MKRLEEKHTQEIQDLKHTIRSQERDLDEKGAEYIKAMEERDTELLHKEVVIASAQEEIQNLNV